MNLNNMLFLTIGYIAISLSLAWDHINKAKREKTPILTIGFILDMMALGMIVIQTIAETTATGGSLFVAILRPLTVLMILLSLRRF